MTALAGPSPTPELQLLEIARVLLHRRALAVGRKDDLVDRVILTRTLRCGW